MGNPQVPIFISYKQIYSKQYLIGYIHAVQYLFVNAGNHVYKNLIHNLHIYHQLDINFTNFILGKDPCLNSVEMFYKDFSVRESAIKNFGRRLHSHPP